MLNSSDLIFIIFVVLCGTTPFSVVSRATLKLIYRFGIPGSDLKTLKSVDFWCKLSSLFLFAKSLESDVLSYSECKTAKIFLGFVPWIHWEGLTAPHPQTTKLHNSISPYYARWKTSTPEKLLDMALPLVQG